MNYFQGEPIPIKYYRFVNINNNTFVNGGLTTFLLNKIYPSIFIPANQMNPVWDVGDYFENNPDNWEEVTEKEYIDQEQESSYSFCKQIDDEFEAYLKTHIIMTSVQMSPFECKINSILESIKSTLLDKNEKYGNAALQPINIFCKSDSEQGILQRIDDKLMRVKNSNELRKNDVFDLMGYLVLLSVQQDYNFDDLKD